MSIKDPCPHDKPNEIVEGPDGEPYEERCPDCGEVFVRFRGGG